MARNTPIFQEDRFLAISPTGKRQTAIDEPMAAGDLTYRLKCEFTRQYIDERKVVLDCDGVDVDDEKLQRSRLVLNLTFPNGVDPQILSIFGFYYLGSAASPTGTPANEVQTLSRSGTVAGGTFTLTLDFEGRLGVTAQIPFDASNAAIKAALTRAASSIGKIIHPDDVAIAGTWGAGITVTFSERLERANLPLLTVNNSLITGGGTVVAGATTTGAQNLHLATRSSARTKTKFCIAAGDKTGSVATEMLYNCAVDSFTPVISDSDDQIGLTVSIICNSIPIELDSFPVPACVSPTPLEKKDCRIKIGSKWETLDLWSQSINLNDAIPTGKELYGFDGSELENIIRSRNPQYAMPTQIFASSNDAIAELVNTKQPVETHFGQPGNRFSVIAGNALLKRQADPFPYVGELGRSVIALDVAPHRDGANPPIRFEARTAQTTSYLAT